MFSVRNSEGLDFLTCWTFRIYFIFFVLGGEEGGVQGDRDRGGRCFIENPRRGGLVLQDKGGGWAKYFISGSYCPPS